MILVLLLACSDYDLREKAEGEEPAPDQDSAAPAVDTADTGDTAEPHETGGDVVVDTGEVATEPVYINTSEELYSYDPQANRSTLIGTFTEGGRPFTEGMTDIAIDLNGIMYGGSYTALYRINPNTAAVTWVASLADEMTGLTFVSDGRLVGAGMGVSFVDTNNGRLTTLVDEGRFQTSGDIVGLPDGKLYWTVVGGDDLVQVDPNTGNARNLGDVGWSKVYGLGYAYGVLYGFTSGGRVLEIDTGSAATLDDTHVPGGWWGATTNPVLW